MSEVRYYTDEHVSRAVVRGLRERGVDVLTVSEADKLGTKDVVHLAFAREERRVVVTHDGDFLRLAAAGYPHAGIVYAPRQIAVGQAIRGLVLIHRVLTAEEMAGHVEFL